MGNTSLLNRMSNVFRRTENIFEERAKNKDEKSSPEYNAIMLPNYHVVNNAPPQLSIGSPGLSDLIKTTYFLGNVSAPISFMQAERTGQANSAGRVIQDGRMRLAEVESFPDGQYLANSDTMYSVEDFTFKTLDGEEMGLPFAMQLRDGSQFFRQEEFEDGLRPTEIHSGMLNRQTQLRNLSDKVFAYNTVDMLLAKYN